jgi:hypothetical protein
MGIVGTREYAERTLRGDPKVPRPLSDRIISSITLMNLSAPMALVVIALLTALSWVAAYFLGGSSDELLGRNGVGGPR